MILYCFICTPTKAPATFSNYITMEHLVELIPTEEYPFRLTDANEQPGRRMEGGRHIGTRMEGGGHHTRRDKRNWQTHAGSRYHQQTRSHK